MREQELQVVKTAYFLEDQIVHQTQELQRVNGDKSVGATPSSDTV